MYQFNGDPFCTGSESFALFAEMQGWGLSLHWINDEDCWILTHSHDDDDLRSDLRRIYADVTGGLADDAG